MAGSPITRIGFQATPSDDTAATAAPQNLLRSTVDETSLMPGEGVFGWSSQPNESIASATRVMTVQDLGRGLVLVHPLFVSVEQTQDECFAVSADLGLIGRGESELDALDDVRDQVGELFESLLELEAALGPDLKAQLAFLRRLATGA